LAVPARPSENLRGHRIAARPAATSATWAFADQLDSLGGRRLRCKEKRYARKSSSEYKHIDVDVDVDVAAVVLLLGRDDSHWRLGRQGEEAVGRTSAMSRRVKVGRCSMQRAGSSLCGAVRQ
jgi:hypothetical protein